MKTYKTVDGNLKLEPYGDGLLFNPETHESYEASMCPEVPEYTWGELMDEWNYHKSVIYDAGFRYVGNICFRSNHISELGDEPSFPRRLPTKKEFLEYLDYCIERQEETGVPYDSISLNGSVYVRDRMDEDYDPTDGYLYMNIQVANEKRDRFFIEIDKLY